MSDENTIDNQKIEEQTKPAKKSHWKIYLHLIIIIILVIVAGYGYLLYQNNQALKLELDDHKSQIVLLKQAADNHQKVTNDISQEKIRCETYISQGEGDFNEFEYCKRIVELIEGLGLAN